jgi:hypothetical protein
MALVLTGATLPGACRDADAGGDVRVDDDDEEAQRERVRAPLVRIVDEELEARQAEVRLIHERMRRCRALLDRLRTSLIHR